MEKNSKTGVELIAEERREQIEKHGRSIELDQSYEDLELMKAAKAMLFDEPLQRWSVLVDLGWDRTISQHMANKYYKERLIIAGALIAAELDRLIHFNSTPTDNGNGDK